MSTDSRYREEYDKMILSGDYPEIFKGEWECDRAEFIKMKVMDEELLYLDEEDYEDFYYDDSYSY